MANPVLVNDLRRSVFRKKPVHAIAYMAVAILVLTLCAATGMDMNLMSQIRNVPLWHVPDLLLPVVVPAFAAGSFAREHEQRTWDDVILTRLGSWEILRGKFLACLVPTVVSIIIMFPPFAMLLILQGVTWAFTAGPWMLIVLIKFLISAFFYISLVMLCSFYGRSGRTALVCSYVLLAAYAVANYIGWRVLAQTLSFDIFGADSDFVRTSQVFGYSQYSRVQEFSLSAVEIAHTVQSLLFGMFIMLFLRRRLGKRG